MQYFEKNIYSKYISYLQITVAPIVPPIVVFLSKHPLVGKFDVSSLKDVISAAAPLGKDTQSALMQRLGVSVRQGNTVQRYSFLIVISAIILES